jgi:hypothetical protein
MVNIDHTCEFVAVCRMPTKQGLRCDLQMTEPSPSLESSLEQHEGSDRRQLTLRVV